MGNLCIHSYSDDHIIYKKCAKCIDTFKVHYGGLSERNSCRRHKYKNGICTFCNKIKGGGGGNCYHSIY